MKPDGSITFNTIRFGYQGLKRGISWKQFDGSGDVGLGEEVRSGVGGRV